MSTDDPRYSPDYRPKARVTLVDDRLICEKCRTRNSPKSALCLACGKRLNVPPIPERNS